MEGRSLTRCCTRGFGVRTYIIGESSLRAVLRGKIKGSSMVWYTCGVSRDKRAAWTQRGLEDSLLCGTHRPDAQ